MGRAEKDCVIDLDQEWVSSLRKKVEVVTHRKHRRIEPRTIFRVPANMREADPDAYEPKIISFGPYHRGKTPLKAMDDLKLRYLRKILRRNSDVVLEDYLKVIKGLEDRARSSYSEEIDMGSNEFVEMMLLDGCFMVELLLMQFDGNEEGIVEKEEDEEEEDDPILSNTWTLPLIEFDMLMLENQLPFFILESLFTMATAAGPNGDDSYSLIKLTLSFFDDHLPSDEPVVPSEEKVPRFYHVLHLFHSCIMPVRFQQGSQSKPYKPSIYQKLVKIKKISSTLCRCLLSSIKLYRPMRVDDEAEHALPPTPESVPSAMVLEEAGVKFKKKDEAESFLDVTFRRGVMEIAPLQVYDQTNSLFRNLIAFEQCYPEAGTHVAAYAVLMDCLIDTANDVALLHRRGCIVNGLGNDEDAAVLFNRLCKEVAIDYGSCYLASLFKDVKKHCESRWNKWRAKLMHDYFSNPWAVLSLAGALILILLTVIQTGFAVLAYFRPPN